MREEQFIGMCIGGFITFVIIMALLVTSMTVVDAGHVGVCDTLGDVSDIELQAGFHFKNPFTGVHQMSIKTQEYTMSIARGEGKVYGDDSISSLSKDMLQLDMDITVLYTIESAKASEIYKTVGENYESTIVRPYIRTSIREIVKEYNATEICSEKRDEASILLEEKLTDILLPRGIIVESVLIRNIKLPDTLENAITEKLAEEQKAQKMAFTLQTERLEAERKVIEAQGIADSQSIIDNTLTPEYLNYLFIQNMEKADTIFVPESFIGLFDFDGVQS